MIGNDFLAAQIYKIISIARTHFFDHTSNEIGLTSKSLFVETPFLLDQVNTFFLLNSQLDLQDPDGRGRRGRFPAGLACKGPKWSKYQSWVVASSVKHGWKIFERNGGLNGNTMEHHL